MKRLFTTAFGLLVALTLGFGATQATASTPAPAPAARCDVVFPGPCNQGHQDSDCFNYCNRAYTTGGVHMCHTIDGDACCVCAH